MSGGVTDTGSTNATTSTGIGASVGGQALTHWEESALGAVLDLKARVLKHDWHEVDWRYPRADELRQNTANSTGFGELDVQVSPNGLWAILSVDAIDSSSLYDAVRTCRLITPSGDGSGFESFAVVKSFAAPPPKRDKQFAFGVIPPSQSPLTPTLAPSGSGGDGTPSDTKTSALETPRIEYPTPPIPSLSQVFTKKPKPKSVLSSGYWKDLLFPPPKPAEPAEPPRYKRPTVHRPTSSYDDAVLVVTDNQVVDTLRLPSVLCWRYPKPLLYRALNHTIAVRRLRAVSGRVWSEQYPTQSRTADAELMSLELPVVVVSIVFDYAVEMFLTPVPVIGGWRSSPFVCWNDSGLAAFSEQLKPHSLEM